MARLRIGVLASHNGTTLQSMIDACEKLTLEADIAVVIGNNSQSGAAKRAAHHGIPFVHLSGHTHPVPVELDRAICASLKSKKINLIVLAGYMKKLGPLTLQAFTGSILNTHPALLPSFGGKGMFGTRVHAAVLEAGMSTTGVTIHLVDERYDNGAVIAQKKVIVLPDDNVDTLSERVQAREKTLLLEVLREVAAGRIDLSTLACPTA